MKLPLQTMNRCKSSSRQNLHATVQNIHPGHMVNELEQNMYVRDLSLVPIIRQLTTFYKIERRAQVLQFLEYPLGIYSIRLTLHHRQCQHLIIYFDTFPSIIILKAKNYVHKTNFTFQKPWSKLSPLNRGA